MRTKVDPYLVDRDDLSLALSDLVLPLHEVPELGLGIDIISSEDSDPVDYRVLLFLSCVLPSTYKVLLNLQIVKTPSKIPILSLSRLLLL